MKNTFVVLLLSGCVVFVNGTEKVSALSTVYVNNTYTSTSTEGKVLGIDVFKTIQEGINAVDEGGTVFVTTGLYNESLNINKSLSLIGSKPLVNIGAHPNAPVLNGGDAIGTILINGEKSPVTVTIKNIIITRGRYGIAVLHNAKVTITKNTISHYLKNGVTFGPVFLPDAGGISGTISKNSITGLGKTDSLAQNGIQISENNTAVISNNIISNHMYTVPGKKWATGILIHQSNGVAILNNTLNANQLGVNLIQANVSTITGNTINGDSLSKAGIMISSYNTDIKNISTGNTVKRNILTGGWIGIWSDYAHGNKYISNVISNSLRDGIYLWNSNNNTITSNMISSIHSTSHTTYGIELDSDTEEGSEEVTKGTANNILNNNTITKSDSGFLVAKNSKNNTFSNNRFNGSITSPVQSDINMLKSNP